MRRTDDFIAVFGLFLVALTAWGSNIYGSQAFMFAVIGLVAVSLLAGDKIIIAFGSFCAVWCVYLWSAVDAHIILFGEAMIQPIDSLTQIIAGIAVYSSVRFGKTSGRAYANAICTLSIFLSLLGLLQFSLGHAPSATLGNQNFLAAFLAISCSFFYRGKVKTFRPQPWWGLVPVIGCLLATKTSTAIVAFLVGAGFFCLGWTGAGLAVIPGVLYFIFFKAPESALARLDYWTDAIMKIGHSWQTIIFGVGPGIGWRLGNTLHSEIAYLIWNFGLIGVLIAAAYLYRAWFSMRVVNRATFSALLVIGVDCAGNHLFHTPGTACLAVIVAALNDRNLSEV